MKNLLLLHGAIGSKEQLQNLKERLSEDFKVHSINFSGHGGEEINGEFSIVWFADEVVKWMANNGIESISIFGYSMGGYVATYLAKHHPSLVDNIITLGTKWEWNEAIAAKETAMLKPEAIEQKVPGFAAQLAKQHHPSDWKQVLYKTADMLTKMGRANPLKQEDFSHIQTKILLLLGDRDKMVTLGETVAAFKLFPSAHLGVLPGTAHAIEAVDVNLLASLIKKFIQ